MTERIPVGWTAALEYQLKKNNAAFDASNMTISIEAYDRHGQALTLGGTASWVTQGSAIAKYTPASNGSDFTVERSPIRWRFLVTDSGGKVAMFPKEGPAEWVIDRT